MTHFGAVGKKFRQGDIDFFLLTKHKNNSLNPFPDPCTDHKNKDGPKDLKAVIGKEFNSGIDEFLQRRHFFFHKFPLKQVLCCCLYCG